MTVASVVIIAVTAVLLLVGLLAVRTANRLDRLHVRTDAARAALEAALDRRAVVTRAVAASLDSRLPVDRGAIGWQAQRLGPAGTARALRGAADHAESARGPDREAAENDLGRLLDALDRSLLEPALATELADAEARVMIARRVYNDAVRDTLALRRRRVVRWLGLAGRAPTPRYFEIAEPVDRS